MEYSVVIETELEIAIVMVLYPKWQLLVKNANDNANEKQTEYIVTFKAWISFNLLTPKRSTYVVRHGHVGQLKKKSRCWISLTIEHRIEKKLSM